MEYDVFISCKSEDYKYAKDIYDYLMGQNVNTFLAPIELRRLGEAEYREAISKALKSTVHMIVFASKAAYVEYPWVKYEWDMFINAKLKGYKSGQILTVLKDVKIDEVTMDLWKYESLDFENYKEVILPYVDTEASIRRREKKLMPQEKVDREKLKVASYVKKEEAKKRAITLAEDFVQWNMAEYPQIVDILSEYGIKYRTCPICNAKVDFMKSYCGNCGWRFAPLEGVEWFEDFDNENSEQIKLIYSDIYRVYCSHKSVLNAFTSLEEKLSMLEEDNRQLLYEKNQIVEENLKLQESVGNLGNECVNDRQSFLSREFKSIRAEMKLKHWVVNFITIVIFLVSLLVVVAYISEICAGEGLSDGIEVFVSAISLLIAAYNFLKNKLWGLIFVILSGAMWFFVLDRSEILTMILITITVSLLYVGCVPLRKKSSYLMRVKHHWGLRTVF